MGEFAEVLELGGLFDKQGTEFFDARAEVDGHGGCQFAVGIDADVEVVTDGPADRFELLCAFADGESGADEIVVDADEAGLGGGVAFLLGLEERFDGGADILVEADAIAGLAAHELVDGNVEGFAEDVPKGDLDGGDGGVEDGPATPAGPAEHGLPVHFDVGGVETDQVALLFEDGFAEGSFFAGDGAFAESGEALVGVDLAEGPVDGADIDDEDFDVCDFEIEGFGLFGGGAEVGEPRGGGCAERGLEEAAAMDTGHVSIEDIVCRGDWVRPGSLGVSGGGRRVGRYGVRVRERGFVGENEADWRRRRVVVAVHANKLAHRVGARANPVPVTAML